VHHRAIPVAFDVRPETLMRVAPANGAYLSAWDHPVREPIECLPEELSLLWFVEVDESIAKCHFCSEIHGHIHKVVLPSKPLAVDHCEHHSTCIIVRHVADHHCCAGDICGNHNAL